MADRYVILLIGRVVFINVYLPCHSHDSLNMLQSILSDISDVICLYPDSHLVLGGDVKNVMSDNTLSDIKLKLI